MDELFLLIVCITFSIIAHFHCKNIRFIIVKCPKCPCQRVINTNALKLQMCWIKMQTFCDKVMFIEQQKYLSYSGTQITVQLSDGPFSLHCNGKEIRTYLCKTSQVTLVTMDP